MKIKLFIAITLVGSVLLMSGCEFNFFSSAAPATIKANAEAAPRLAQASKVQEETRHSNEMNRIAEQEAASVSAGSVAGKVAAENAKSDASVSWYSGLSAWAPVGGALLVLGFGFGAFFLLTGVGAGVGIRTAGRAMTATVYELRAAVFDAKVLSSDDGAVVGISTSPWAQIKGGEPSVQGLLPDVNQAVAQIEGAKAMALAASHAADKASRQAAIDSVSGAIARIATHGVSWTTGDDGDEVAEVESHARHVSVEPADMR